MIVKRILIGSAPILFAASLASAAHKTKTHKSTETNTQEKQEETVKAECVKDGKHMDLSKEECVKEGGKWTSERIDKKTAEPTK